MKQGNSDLPGQRMLCRILPSDRNNPDFPGGQPSPVVINIAQKSGKPARTVPAKDGKKREILLSGRPAAE